VPDARTSDAIRRELVEAFDVASALFVPLILDGEVRRVAILLTHAPRVFTPGDIADAEALANVAAAGLARLEGDHRRTASASCSASPT
jgi:GAF domain-containing protein